MLFVDKKKMKLLKCKQRVKQVALVKISLLVGNHGWSKYEHIPVYNSKSWKWKFKLVLNYKYASYAYLYLYINVIFDIKI